MNKWYTIPFVLFFFVLSWSNLTAQDELYERSPSIWKTLSKVTYKKEFDEIMGFKVDVPVFSDQVKELEGTRVKVKGYIIPTEGFKSHQEFIFSAYPYNMCFFCGGAGPETVMEIIASEPIKYTTEAVTIEGTLVLNSKDVNKLMYGLKDTVKVEE